MNQNFSQQSLIEKGTLQEEDWTLVANCRGDYNKLGFTYQLIFIRLLNILPNQSPFEIIDEIVIYAAIQLSIDNASIEKYKNNRKKIYDHQQEIIQHLNYKEFDDNAQSRLNSFILEKSLQFESVGLLQIKSVEFLQKLQILLPAPDTLLRIVKKQRFFVRKKLFDKIRERLSSVITKNLDTLLIVKSTYSEIEYIKRPIKNASVDAVLDIIARLETIIQTGVMDVDLSDINNNYKRTLANEIKRCSVSRIRKMETTKKYTAIIFFLQQAYQDYLDILISTYIKLINTAYTRAENEVVKQNHRNEDQLRDSLESYEEMKDIIRGDDIPDDQLRATLLKKFSEEFEKDLPAMRCFLNGKSRQIFQVFIKKYSYFRQFTTKIFPLLHLQSELSSYKSTTLESLNILIGLNNNSKRKLPKDVSLSFVSKELKKIVVLADGTVDKRAWECLLYLKIRDEIKQGNINAPESKRYSSIKTFNIDDNDWSLFRNDFFKRSSFPKEAKEARPYLTERLGKAYSDYFASESQNNYAKVVDGEWSIGVDTKDDLSADEKEELKKMKSWLSNKMRGIKLPELLVEVDNELYFTEPMTTFNQNISNRIKDIFDVLATLMAHGCNIGKYTMPKLMEGITYERICRVTDWQLTEDALRSSLSRLVNSISKLGVTQYWGSGKCSSSDAHLKEFKQKVSQQTYQPNFGGFAIAFYTFVADNYAPFHCKPFECSEGEAPHALDGHLYNESDLEFEEHFTDTRPAATILFSSFAWYGTKYSPRIKGIQNHNIYMIDTKRDYGNLAPLLKHKTARINMELIEKHWDQMAQFHASIEKGKITASVALRRLLSLSKKNEFFKANLMLGRILKTEHILQHMSDPEYRRKKHRGLLKGEEIHQLGRDINYANRGKISARTDKGLIICCNSLTIILAAIIYWQAKELNRLINSEEFKTMGFNPKLMAHISPVGWDNVVLYGEYIINIEKIKR